MNLPSTIYLAGPMEGYAEHNFPFFNRVTGRLRDQGYKVFNPAENADGNTRQKRSFYMRLDIPALLKSEGVVLLPGWRKSRGANLEVWIAVDLDLPIFEFLEVDGDMMFEPLGNHHSFNLPFAPT